MKGGYSTEELLALSGIQHFVFCRRQWALIYLEGQWQDNQLTAEGKNLHDRTDDPYFSESRSGVIIARALAVASYTLGLAGVCDVVEFSPSPDGVTLPGRSGLFLPVPVEYKHGKPKSDPCDEAQVCAQAMCLEEMLAVNIPHAFLYYGQTRHRVMVTLGEELRAVVISASSEMHAYYERGYTPRVRKKKACQSCSIRDSCLPELQARSIPASRYIIDKLKVDEP